MPRTSGLDERRRLYAGAGEGLSKAVDIVVATGVWAAIGFGLDRWLGTWPVLFAIGAVVGNLTGIYVLYRRSLAEAGDRAEAAAAGVTRNPGTRKGGPGRPADGGT